MSIDATDCQKTIAEAIIDSGADGLYYMCQRQTKEPQSQNLVFTIGRIPDLSAYKQSYFNGIRVMAEKNIENVFVIQHFTRRIFIRDGKG